MKPPCDKRPSAPMRTLVVDGSRAFLEGVARWAEDRPELVVVGTERDGLAALDAVERLDPDLVLLDAVLPGLDGFHVVRKLKERSAPPVAVIATLLASSAVRSGALAAGADGFVAKDDFSAALEELLGPLAARVAERRSRLSPTSS